MLRYLKSLQLYFIAILGSLSMLVDVVSAQKISENFLKQIEPDNGSSNNSLDRITNVSELKDVAPTDWAFEALRNLLERYGCLAGYPDRTFRGDRPLSRYEFAAGLNACLEQIERSIAQNGTISQEDLETLNKLTQQFATELKTLGERVDKLETKVDFLEQHQFSTTTKLKGQALFAVAGTFGDRKANSTDSIDDEIFFSNRVRLIFDSSFNGKDLLRIRLQAGNTPDLNNSTGTRTTRFAFTADNNNDLVINQLEYRFPIKDKGTVFLEAFGFLDLFVPTLHPIDGDYNTVITGFSLRSPIYFQSGVTGIGFNYDLTNWLSIGGGYLAGDPTAGNPTTGLFNGPYGALGQLTFRPTKKFAFALTYLNGYDDGSGNAPPGGFFGSQNATFPFGEVATSYNSYGVEAQYNFSSKFSLSGWVGLTQAEAQSGIFKGNNADIWYWAVTLSLFDLGKEGNLGGLVVGQPTKVTNNDVAALEDKDTSILIEAFYRHRLTDNISITPGLVVVTNPEHNDDNDTVFVGVVRTVFDF